MAIVFVSLEGDRSRLEILQSEAHTVSVDVYEDDQPVALDASASKAQVQKPSGDDLVSKTTATVAAGEDGGILAIALIAPVHIDAASGVEQVPAKLFQ